MTNSPTTNQGQFNPADYDLDRVIRILTASVLGDGGTTMQKLSKNAYYRTAKTIGHDDYFNWLRSVVELVAPTRTEFRPEKQMQGLPYIAKACDVLVSRTNPIFTEIHRLVYVNGQRVVPEGLSVDLESIAVLLMDDGCRCANWGFNRIATHAFSLDSVEILQEKFIEASELPWAVVKGTPSKSGSPTYQLYLARRHAVELTAVLKPFVFPSYYYKLGLELDGVTEIPLKMRSI